MHALMNMWPDRFFFITGMKVRGQTSAMRWKKFFWAGSRAASRLDSRGIASRRRFTTCGGAAGYRYARFSWQIFHDVLRHAN